MKLTLAVTGTLFLLLAIIFLNLGHWLSAPASAPIPADLIVSLGGDGGERGQMAATLYKAGYAKKILLTGMGGCSNITGDCYQHKRSLFLLNQGIATKTLIFDEQATSTHQEVINIAALLRANHWVSVLIVSDPPHMLRLDYALRPVFKKAGLHSQLIKSDAPTWHADRWWQDERWAQFCAMEVVKLIYYALAYNN